MKYLILLPIIFLATPCLAENAELAVKNKAEAIASQLNDNFSSTFVHDPVKFSSSGENIFAVPISLEGLSGGNSFDQYLAVYQLEPDARGDKKISGPSYRLIALSIVGKKMWQYVNFNSMQFANETFYFDATRYAPNDPGCCPSQKLRVTYKLADLGFK